MNTSDTPTRVLIVGGGFGGIKAALELSKQANFAVTLLSDRPNFHYYPTLYHTATGGAVRQSRIPLSELFAGRAVSVAYGAAQKLDRRAKTIIANDGQKYAYDVLILALGVVTNYFGIQGLQEFSYSIKSPEDAQRFKNHLHEQLTAEHKPDVNYVIAGGGPTGIELAGSMPAYVHEIMKAHGIKHRAVHVDLVEAAPKLVPRLPDRMSRAITRRLRKLGIKLYLKSAVQGASADELTVNGKPIQSHTIVWTAGVTNHPFFKENNFALNERGKVQVNEYLETEDNIYVIGDNADTPYSGLAQTALYDAIFVARNLERKAAGKLMQRYVPKQPIYVIPVGPRWAAVQWGRVQFYGLIGWLLRNAADYIGFKDVEPWWKAAEQWTSEFETEDACPQCARQRAQG